MTNTTGAALEEGFSRELCGRIHKLSYDDLPQDVVKTT